MKTFEEIMSGVTDHVHYARSASQLTSLALTKFAKQISEKGAKTLLFVGSHNLRSNETTKRRLGFETYCIDNHIDYYIIDLLEPHNNFTKDLKVLLSPSYGFEYIQLPHLPVKSAGGLINLGFGKVTPFARR